MGWTRKLTLSAAALVVLLAMLAGGISGEAVRAQDQIIPLRVQTAVTGELTSSQPTVVYSINAAESLRMAAIFDVTGGDMQPTLVVLDQDQQTVLAGATGPNANGVIVTFPTEGTYYVGVTADSGTSATYRLMIEVAPPLPVNVFVAQSYMVSGTSAVCADNTPVGQFTPTEDLNVCFSLDLIDNPIDIKVEWWSPSGTIAANDSGKLDSSLNGQLLLSGIVYPGEPFETGWWQVHFLLDGELAYVQWVLVVEG